MKFILRRCFHLFSLTLLFYLFFSSTTFAMPAKLPKADQVNFMMAGAFCDCKFNRHDDGNDEGVLLTSANGKDWDATDTSYEVGPLITNVVKNGDLFMATGCYNNFVSKDGKNWDVIRSNLGYLAFWQGIAQAKDKTFILANDDETGEGVLLVTDGHSLQEVLRKPDRSFEKNVKVFWVKNEFIFLSEYWGTITTYTSPDGMHWTVNPAFPGLTVVAYHNEKYFGFDRSGTLMSSADGIHWKQGQYLQEKITDLIRGNDVYVAIGLQGGIYTSKDGEHWSSQKSGTNKRLNKIAYRNGLYVIAGKGGLILTSEDAIHWTSRESHTNRDLAGVAG